MFVLFACLQYATDARQECGGSGTNGGRARRARGAWGTYMRRVRRLVSWSVPIHAFNTIRQVVLGYYFRVQRLTHRKYVLESAQCTASSSHTSHIRAQTPVSPVRACLTRFLDRSPASRVSPARYCITRELHRSPASRAGKIDASETWVGFCLKKVGRFLTLTAVNRRFVGSGSKPVELLNQKAA